MAYCSGEEEKGRVIMWRQKESQRGRASASPGTREGIQLPKDSKKK